MFRRIRYELRFILDNVAIVLLGAFFACMSGMLLWINGGSTWYIVNIMHNVTPKLPLSVIFLLWLLTYGIIGAVLALLWLVSRTKEGNSKHCLAGFGLIMLAFLLDLSWYAAFCCTRLSFFAAILLIISSAITIAALIITCRELRILSFGIIFIAAAEIYFAIFSLSTVF